MDDMDSFRAKEARRHLSLRQSLTIGCGSAIPFSEWQDPTTISTYLIVHIYWIAGFVANLPISNSRSMGISIRRDIILQMAFIPTGLFFRNRSRSQLETSISITRRCRNRFAKISNEHLTFCKPGFAFWHCHANYGTVMRCIRL
jgi:hypothetical protein